jgi:hypothetical protein
MFLMVLAARCNNLQSKTHKSAIIRHKPGLFATDRTGFRSVVHRRVEADDTRFEKASSEKKTDVFRYILAICLHSAI